MSLILFIFVVIVLIILSGFFSGSETALTAVSRARMHQLEREGSSAAREVNRLVADKERMIGAILFGNTFLNILISSLTTEVLAVRPFSRRADSDEFERVVPAVALHRPDEKVPKNDQKPAINGWHAN